MLKLSNQSKLYKDLTDCPVIKSKGLLWYLVNYLCSRYVTNESGTQTEFDGVHNIAASLDFKLKNIDDLYSNKANNFNQKLSFEDKIVVYQKRVEEKLKEEYEKKISDFKEFELARIRVEERDKLRVETTGYRMEIEKTYQSRNQALSQREQACEDLLKQKKEMEEREIHGQRQALLEEVRQLRERETSFKQSCEANMKLNRMDTSKFDKAHEELRARESRLKQAEEDFEKRLHSERERMKIDLDRAYGHREFLLQSVENKNKQDAQHNDIERTQLERIKHEHQASSITISELQLQVQKLTGEVMCLTQENELVKDKLGRCMDYEFIKQENKMLKYKLEVSKELIGEKSVAKSARRSTNITPREPVSQVGNNSVGNSYVPVRKRSVTFASEIENGNQGLPKLAIINDEGSEMGADPVFTENEASVGVVSYRDEGDKMLSEALEIKEMEENLESHQVLNSELKDLYEMQVFEQRKLHETIK